jgi:hypothetical protein
MNESSWLRRTLLRRDIIGAVAVFFILSGLMTSLKMIDITFRMGDTAVYLQVVDNIVIRGTPASQLEANLVGFLHSGLLHKTAAEVARDPLAPPALTEYNELRGHEYLVLYPIAALAKFLPSDFVLMMVDSLSFTVFLLLAYLYLRCKDVSVGAACLFCLLIVFHPAWSDGLLYGQFYPDRLFLPGALGLMILATATQSKYRGALFVGAAVFCALIHERAAITAGIALVLCVVLYWRSSQRNRNLALSVGVALLSYGAILIAFVVDKSYNTHYFHFHDIAGAVAIFRDPEYVQYTLTFLLVNTPLLVLALFEPRAALIAAVVMLPNIFGSIGGAEKTGWSTHYQSYYFPILTWAALMGYVWAYRHAMTLRRRMALYGSTAFLIVFLAILDPYSTRRVSVNVAHVWSTFIPEVMTESRAWLSADGLRHKGLMEQAQRAVPENTVVTTPEGLMSILYKNRTLRFFPVDIDHADYAVLTVLSRDGDRVVYGGASSNLGPKEQQKINEVIVARMRRDGYDFAHAIFIPVLSAAIVKRIH